MALVLLGIALLFVGLGQPVTRPLLVREGDRLAEDGHEIPAHWCISWPGCDPSTRRPPRPPRRRARLPAEDTSARQDRLPRHPRDARRARVPRRCTDAGSARRAEAEGRGTGRCGRAAGGRDDRVGVDGEHERVRGCIGGGGSAGGAVRPPGARRRVVLGARCGAVGRQRGQDDRGRERAAEGRPRGARGCGGGGPGHREPPRARRCGRRGGGRRSAVLAGVRGGLRAHPRARTADRARRRMVAWTRGAPRRARRNAGQGGRAHGGRDGGLGRSVGGGAGALRARRGGDGAVARAHRAGGEGRRSSRPLRGRSRRTGPRRRLRRSS